MTAMATESARGAVPGRGFGPSALITPANGVTVFRVLVTPILIAMILGGGSSWPAIVFWVGLCGTDWVDGYLARRQGATRSGAFLDPLADKFMVLGAMFALVAEDVFWWLPVVVITARELVISLYRVWMGRQGVSVPARWSAKVKTVVQQVAVGLALLPLTDDHPDVANVWLWAAVGLALVSGAQYLLDGNRAARAV